MISSKVFLSVSLIFALATVVYQRMNILNLQRSLSDSTEGFRGRRSLGNYESAMENEIRDDYLPIYAEMTKSQLRRLCEKHSTTIGFESKISRKKTHLNRDHQMRKHCSIEVSMTAPRLITKRPHTVGSAFRDGKYWFVFEYHLGYTLLVFHNESALVDSMPSKIFTLPYPFHGTDGTVHNRTVVYLFGESLIAHNLETKTTRHHAINASHDPLYQGSTSRIDVSADEHGLWVLYKEKTDKSLTVLRLHLKNLKELGKWRLDLVDSSDWCNSFVRCGTLFSVKCHENSTISIDSSFDFYRNRLIHRENRRYEWKIEDLSPLDGLGSAQFDPLSRTSNLFARGRIYSSQFGN